jgi:hypothetical protein
MLVFNLMTCNSADSHDILTLVHKLSRHEGAFLYLIERIKEKIVL